VLILLIFLNVATLGSGSVLFVNSFITLLVSSPETLTMAIPEIPGPVDKAYMVITISIFDIIYINIFLIMNSKEEIFNKAKKFHMSGNIIGASKLYLKLIEVDKDNFLFQNLLGTALLQLKKYDEAIKHLDISIKLNPNYAESFGNKGIAHAEKQQYQEAINNYDKAINLKKNFYSAYLNKGIALKNTQKYKDAIRYFEFCLKINPRDPKIFNNLGNLFIKQKKFHEALKAFDKAISFENKFAEAYSNRAETNEKLGNYKQAILDYDEALKINNNLDYVRGKILHAKMRINEWENFDAQVEILKKEIKNDKKIISPFPLLSLIDDPELHKLVAEQHSHNIFKNLYNKNKVKVKVKDKIKISYFSAEFHQHPVLQLMMDVYKNHNKDRFEVYGFSHDPVGENNYRNEAKGYFNKFIDITKMKDDDVVKLCREMEIDIAINLTGHTANSRDNIFYHHVAPIQINYLGYPGTLGSKIYDYIIADKIILPKKFKKNYSEEVLYLPSCYQPNQTKLEISKKNFRKKDFNLPKDSFVFGCFNNSYKITPNIFNCWMRILKKSENSVLWLLASSNIGRDNLKKESMKNGVDPKRIIFADRVSVEEHLKRIGLIDLFLDTYPYNAHTTAREAIKMSVPILTLIGESFASRVASSLLKNVGLEELIVNNIHDYARVAIKIANDKKKLRTLKNHLSKSDNTKKLFNNEKFTKDLEKIYENILK